MPVTVTLRIGGQALVAELDDAALAAIAAAIGPAAPAPPSPWLSIPEAAEYLRTSRQAVDDLLSAGRLARHKVGRRTLVARNELQALVTATPARRRADG